MGRPDRSGGAGRTPSAGPAPARFAGDRRAIAAVEFAMVAPILALVMAGAFEMSRAANTARRVTTVANAAATMLAAAQPAPTSSSAAPPATAYLRYTDLHYAFDATMLIFPDVLRDAFAKGVSWDSDISISMAGISFTPSGCTTNCTARVDWTGGAMQRACGSTIVSAPDGAAPSKGTLPANLYATVATPAGTAGPQYAVVVDVTYTWKPIVFARFATMTFSRSAFITPRYTTSVKYQTVAGDDGFGKVCP